MEIIKSYHEDRQELENKIRRDDHLARIWGRAAAICFIIAFCLTFCLAILLLSNFKNF
jgi:hypothetical protein